MFELRRKFLRAGISISLLSSTLASGLLLPNRVIAAEWLRSAFSASNINDSLKALSAASARESRDITITAPEVAENGAKVNIEISCNIPKVRQLAILADKNPLPLCATLDFSENVLPYAKFQIKLAETTRLRVVARTQDGTSYIAFRDVRVTIGGCKA